MFCIPLCCISYSVVSDSLQPHGLQPARFLCPWDSPGKNTRVDCHSLLQLTYLRSLNMRATTTSPTAHNIKIVLPSHFSGSSVSPSYLQTLVRKKERKLVAQSCPTLCNPMDCSRPRSSVHGILQARVLEWIQTLSCCEVLGSENKKLSTTWPLPLKNLP